MISCLGAPTHHLLMPRDPFQLSFVVTSQYSKIFFLEKVSGKSPESFPESLPIWVKGRKKVFTMVKNQFAFVSFKSLTPLCTSSRPISHRLKF